MVCGLVDMEIVQNRKLENEKTAFPEFEMKLIVHFIICKGDTVDGLNPAPVDRQFIPQVPGF